MEPCPSECIILRLVRGELEESGVEQLLLHTEVCENCALVVAEAGLAISAEVGDEVSPDEPSAERGSIAPGSLIACRYRVQARVGRGGMGEVYSVTDEELGERVALKTITPALARDPLLVEHFKRELRLARKVAHPNVCKTLEFGRHELETGASQCFFTMQFIDGVTLRRRLRDAGAFELDAALSMVRDLALGLQAIHEQNIVHRDIKPDNVMLTFEETRIVPLWLDFGVARVDLRESTSRGVLAGTPDYAAPELLRGEVATRASDLYALGLVLYEVLVGDLPFSPVGSFSEAARRRYLVPAAPSAFRSELPAALDQLVLECLATSPQHRPTSAGQVAARLRSIQAKLSVNRPAAGSIEQEPVRRRWLWPVAATGLIALLGTSFVQSRSARIPETRSQREQTPRELSPPRTAPSSAPSNPTSAAASPFATGSAPATAALAAPAARPKAARAKPAETPLTAASAPLVETITTATTEAAHAPTTGQHTVSDFGGRR